MGNFEAMTTTPLTIKELAHALGVSVKYVELMHEAGFPMQRSLLDGYGLRSVLTATVSEAMAWREVNEFRLVHCHPVKTIGQMRFGFRVEKWTGFISAVTNGQSRISNQL